MPRRARGYYLRCDRKSGRWEIAWAEPGTGRVRSRSTGETDRRRAEEILGRFVADITRPGAPERMTVAQIAELYARDLENRSGWWRTHERAVAHFVRHLGWLRFEEVRSQHGKVFVEKRATEGAARGTIIQQLRMAHAILGWWAEKHELRAPAFRAPKAAPPRKRWLTEEEAERLIEAAESPHLKLFLVVALMTGARTGAILDLRWDQVDLGHRTVDFGEGHGHKERISVPINDRLASVLVEAREMATSPFVIEYAGGRIHRVQSAFHRLAKKVGLSDVRPHDLRRTAASWMLQRGVTLEFVSRMLGHRSIKTTEAAYAHLAVGHLRNAAAALDVTWRNAAATLSQTAIKAK